MNILILALGSRGDVLPYAALGARLVQRGHRAGLVTTENYAPMGRRAGLDFHPISGDSEQAVRSAGADYFALNLAFLRLSRGFAMPEAAWAGILSGTDLLLNQLPLAAYGRDLAEKFSLPMVQAAVLPLTETAAYPMMGFPMQLSVIPGYNRLSYRIWNRLAWMGLGPVVNRWRTRELGLKKSWSAVPRVPLLYGISPRVLPRPADWGPEIHLTGYWHPDPSGWQPPESLVRFIEAGPPPVFIGFGSMPVRRPEAMTRMILEALARAGRRGIIHAGWAGLGRGSLPKDVYSLDYAPFNWLFPRMAAVVHHGGSGTTAYALRAGSPSLVVPFLFDQFFWGERTRALGAGPEPIPFRRLSAPRLAAALDRMADDVNMQRRARRLGAALASEDGIKKAAEVVESIRPGH